MKTLLNSINLTANAAKISGGGSSHVLKHLFTIVTLLLTVGVGEMWADVWIRGDMNNWENNDAWKFNDGKLEVSLEANTDYTFKVWDEVGLNNDHYRSYDLNGGKITGTIEKYNLDKDNVDGYNLVLHTDEAGTYIFQYAYEDSKYKLSIYFPKARLQKQKYVYFDARRLTGSNSDYWQRGNFTARFYFKYYDSGVDNGNLDCTHANALEDWVYYALVPDHDYIGQIQLNRLQVETEALCVANIAYAKDRPSSLENCLQEESGKENYCNEWTPQWTTYCPPMSSVSLSDNGTTNWGGDGSSVDPYLVPTDASIEVQASEAVSVLDDDNMTVYYRFKKEGTEVQAGSATATATITASSTTGTKEAVTVEAYNYYNSTSGTSVASTAIYYEARTPYTISYNKGTPAASISGSRESEIKLKDVTFTLPGAIFTRTGYTQTGWATSDGGAKAYELSASYTANEAVTLYPFWTPKTYTVRLEGMEADGESLPIDVNVTYDAVLTTLENKHTKAHYDLLGYWAASDNEGKEKTVKLIDANGDWIKDVAGYTGNDGEGHPTWGHDNSISLFADWTEHPYTITTSVSPAGAGTLSCASTIEAHWVTPTSTITATANPAWKFVRWEYSDYVGPATGTGLDNTVQINATVDGTLTAVFEPRFCLVGSIWNNSGNGGMPGWSDYTADFTVNSYTDLSTMNLTCVRSLDPNTTYKFEVHDKVKGKNFGYSVASTFIADQSLLFNTQNEDVLLRVNGHGECTFTISALSSGDLYPTVSVAIPSSHQLKLEWAYVRINGDWYKTSDDVGGTVSAQTTESGHHFAIHNDEYVAHGGDITYTATPATGYTFEGWYNNDYNTRFSTTNPYTSFNIQTTENVEAKFVEKATAVTLSNDGHGHVEIDGEMVSNTTVGVTTHRDLTAVPDEGYKFDSWTIVSGSDITLSSTSTNPTTLSANGAGTASGQEVRANFVERYSIKGTMNSEDWGTDHIVSNIETVGGKVIGYVDISLLANTSYEFAIYDLQESQWLKNGSDRVYYMTNGNSHNWSFATDKTWNCGITTAGAGTYRFIWNITDKKMTVTYPNFIIYRTGDKEGDPRAQDTDVESYDGGTIEKAIEYRMKVHTLDEWTTLCLPFTISAVKVWDDGDGAYYDIKPFYRSGGKFYTGHYIIRKPETVTNYAIETFEENWLDPTSPTGYLPSANTPYIIQWHDTYFSGKYISFFSPTGQTIPTAFSAGSAPSADDVVNVYGNNTMHSGTVRDAYLLEPDYGPSGAWLREEIGTDRTILPFECFIRASQQGTARYRILRRGMEIDTPTALEQISNHQSPMTIRVYTITGVLIGEYNDCSFQDAAHRIATDHNEGIYILRSENESMKLLLGGK